MLTDEQRSFLEQQRVAHFATIDTDGLPHVVPVCYSVLQSSGYITLDKKPKRVAPMKLQRVRNLTANPKVALVIDHYDEDWAKLGWVLLRGKAEVLQHGAEHHEAQCDLRRRYAQYRTMAIETLPVIAIRIERITSWGQLT